LLLTLPLLVFCKKEYAAVAAAHEIITWDLAMHWRSTVIRTWKILNLLLIREGIKEVLIFGMIIKNLQEKQF